MQEKDFETPDGPRAPMDVAEFYDSLETKRMARLDGLVQQYNSIESLLIKVTSRRLYRSSHRESHFLLRPLPSN